MASKGGAATTRATAKDAAANTAAATESQTGRRSATTGRKSTASKKRSGADTKGSTRKTLSRAPRSPRVTELPVLEQEDPWTPEELSEVRTELETELARLRDEVDEAEADLAELMRDSGEGSGDDQADAGAATWEREHELSLTNNARELLDQIQRALERIDEGTYGACESCGNPIGKMRLQAFPRATLCLSCKQQQERR